MLTTQQVLQLWLGIGEHSTHVRALVETGGSLEQIVATPADDLVRLGFKRHAIAAMANVEPARERSESQIALAAAYDARIITFWDDSYPARLREIYNAPAVLFVQGTFTEADTHSIAIVGTRGATTYGRLQAERYGAECASIGVTVVSGLARGIDTYAHLAALETGGRTIAIVASGLDSISPSSAARLAARITHHGCVMSEHPFGVPAIGKFFPARNRIISGIARATVIVESDVEGGAMITANFANDQCREAFAIAGPNTSPKSRGTNLLIRTTRAHLTQTPEDVFIALNYLVAIDGSALPSYDVAQLSLFEQQIFDVLGEEPLHVDELCDSTGITTSEMLVNLLQLEFKGLARQMAGKMFLRARRVR